MAAVPDLPTRFPCWCRAVYSWGGETKRDLGFVEGDLIECLNAGDGSWWVGRLYRDKRITGQFPSNFVQVLDEKFRPATRAASPLPNRSPSPAPTQQKTKPFRKPFQAYAAPDTAAIQRAETRAQEAKRLALQARASRSRSAAPSSVRHKTPSASSPAPRNGHGSTRGHSTSTTPHRARSRTQTGSFQAPAPTSQYVARAPSPAPPVAYQNHQRGPSPAPYQQGMHDPRGPSPSLYQSMYDPRGPSPTPYQNRPVSRGPSPNPYQGMQDPQGPSPNPYQNRPVSRGPSPNPYQGRHDPRGPSPSPYQAVQNPRRQTPDLYQALQDLRGQSPNPYQNRPVSRGPSPNPYQGMQNPRGPSPNPYQNRPVSRGPSPSPYQVISPVTYSGRPVYQPVSREPSPNPYQANPHSRAVTPDPYEEEHDSPPPPPPPHRVLRNPAAQTPQPGDGYRGSRGPSPAPSEGGGTGLTPSPLRNAMEDLMTSLEGIKMTRGSETPTPAEPINSWSPEAFSELYTPRRNHTEVSRPGTSDSFDPGHPQTIKRNPSHRPNTSMGIAPSHNFDDNEDAEETTAPHSYDPRYKYGISPPKLSNYVERMEKRLQEVKRPESRFDEPREEVESPPPAVPEKRSPVKERPKSSFAGTYQEETGLPRRKSAYDIGKQVINRTFTTKTSATSSSNGSKGTTLTTSSGATEATDRSLMSGYSAGGFSATSAGSLARKAGHSRAQTALGIIGDSRPDSPFTGVTYHSSHHSHSASGPLPERAASQASWRDARYEAGSPFGGLAAPKPKKTGFFRKIVETARTQAANARNNYATNEGIRPGSSRSKSVPNFDITGIAGGTAAPPAKDPAAENGMPKGAEDWVQVRRDINRSNSISRNERDERTERCHMMDLSAIPCVEEFYETIDGDEGIDGQPIYEAINFHAVNYGAVDKNARFVTSLPPMTNPASLATGHICRPYRSDVQRLRAIFTWISEKIIWEEEFEGPVDAKRVIQTKRGSAHEVAALVVDMCAAVGIQAEKVRGFLKPPGEVFELGHVLTPNHWWNAVVVDGQWRMMDCSLASPSNPRRGEYSSASSQVAESWWFLARPSEICWTHIPLLGRHQHICPHVMPDVLLALPCASAPFFRNNIQLIDFNTSIIRMVDLEVCHIKFTVPADVECVAEVETRAVDRDSDGDFFETGEMNKKRVFCMPEWLRGTKQYTVKALLPEGESQGILKVYAGPRGLMHSSKDIPHPLAFALPLLHEGENPAYEFVKVHPTPHAQRHDLYVAQPQCQRLYVNNTTVFHVRQHPASTASSSNTSTSGAVSPIPFARPLSAMSTSSVSASGSNPSTASSGSGSGGGKKPAKLGLQAPSGKIYRFVRKESRYVNGPPQGADTSDGSTWEAVLKCGERGGWRGLVLADRSARWCVFAEWEVA